MSTPTELNPAVLFERLQRILSDLYGEVTQHLEIFPKADQPFHHFSSPDGTVTGSLLTFSGKGVDKLIYSWLRAAPMGFSTLRLTLWLGPQIAVPHLAFEVGTMPHLLFYMDYIPRVDGWAEPGYIDHYYEALNSTYLALRENPSLSQFVSKGLSVRHLQSPAHLCFTGAGTEESLALIQQTAHDMLHRWLGWIEQAPAVPSEGQVALAERDLRMRRISAERDPGNAMAAKLFGPDFTDQLVRSLWLPESNP